VPFHLEGGDAQVFDLDADGMAGLDMMMHDKNYLKSPTSSSIDFTE
jgi:hypothetical protein